MNENQIRQVLLPVILAAWDNHHLTLLAGDLNVDPDSAVMVLLSKAGLIDSWLEAVVGEG